MLLPWLLPSIELCLIDGNGTQGDFRAAGVKVERSIDQRPGNLPAKAICRVQLRRYIALKKGSSILARRFESLSEDYLSAFNENRILRGIVHGGGTCVD